MTAEALAQEYLDAAAEVDRLTARQKDIRDELRGILRFNEVHDAKVWELGPAKVVWVKGRTTDRLDKAKLVQLGVTAQVIAAATVHTVGQPTMRIVAADSPAEGAE